MTATLASSHWPASNALARDARWRFGCAFSQPAQSGWRWDLRRSGWSSPRQFALIAGPLCVVSPWLALGWRSAGMPLLLFGVGELLALGLALLLLERHAGDRELITLTEREMAVEQHRGPSVECTRLRAEWVRVEPAAGERSLVELSGEGQCVRVGRHVRPELRSELAQELRDALRMSRAVGERVGDHKLKASR